MNIAMLLDMATDGFGHRTAVRSAEPDGLTLDYARLRSTAAAVAADLRAAAPRAALAYLGPTNPAAPVALFGAAYAGTVYAPLNHRLPAASLSALIARTLPARAVARTQDLATATEAGAHPVTPLDDWLAGLLAAPGVPDGPLEPQAPAILLFTSGTSAQPKAIKLSHDNLLAYILGTVEFGSAGEDEALLLAVPPFHIAGVSAVLSSVYCGRTIVTLPAFTAEEWLAAARRHAITHAFLVPTMLTRIVEAMEADPSLRVPTLRHLAYGGARMPLPVLERALELFPDAGFVNAYGLTETSSTIAVLGPDDHRAAHQGNAAARARLGSVGRPVPSIEVRIQDEAGVEVKPGMRGELLLRGPQVAAPGSGAATDADGWFATGDLATLDDAGYLFVHGRGDDTIIRGGENIGPGEIEDTLLRHPAVAAVCVVGLPDPEWGERIEAAVVLHPGEAARDSDLAEWLRGRLGSLKTPQRLHFVAELPMTPTGKIIRRQVKADLAERE
ncbi:class I adenylate-forming enzyme family protein [Streptomyces sp. NPDC002577]